MNPCGSTLLCSVQDSQFWRNLCRNVNSCAEVGLWGQIEEVGPEHSIPIEYSELEVKWAEADTETQ